MKRCPECRRSYTDETLNYCLDDGSALVDGPSDIHSTAAPSAETATVMMHTTGVANEGPTSFHAHTTNLSSSDNAIAVLPFANLSRSEDSEYLSDGLAEELLNVLSKINGLRVAARTSAFAFKGKQASVEEIGRALHVSSVLEGSVRMAGNRVRIAVQLADVQNGYHLWSQTYDRTMDDIFAIQDDIAQSVVGELREKLVGGDSSSGARHKVAAEVATAVKGRAADPEAHRLMLLARHLTQRINEADVTKGVEYLEKALAIDPDYAMCWFELGRAFNLASNYGWYSLDTDFEKTEAALKKALELDPDLAEGHARLAQIRFSRDMDVAGAEEGLKRALALEPENIIVISACAFVDRDLGRFEKVLDYCRRMKAIDPLNPGGSATAAYVSYLSGDLDEARSAYQRVLELAPQRVAIHAHLALVYLRQKRTEDALAEALLEPENTIWRYWSLAIIYHLAGQISRSDSELAKAIEIFGSGGSFQIAEIHSMRGDLDEAFEWLERAIERRDPGRTSTKVSPLLKPLHNDPRWLPLLKKIGFPD